MSDLSRNDINEIVLRDDGLKQKHLTIIINEKINQIKQLDNTLERMKTVDFKRLELQKEILAKEIEQLQDSQVKPPATIDAEVVKNSGGET